ncbi:hypothetical protein [Sorangium sp. So ce861]|uniref:hypothetical protein n=1 Tax=Sorangium sp. So ce861 TaxID=3133323 RepID=UPI003F62BDC3
MAVAIEFANVILRKSALERHVPGGIDALAQRPLPNLVEDEHLVRVGFMSTSDGEALISEVAALASPSFGPEGDVALVQWNVLPYPAWLTVGVVDDSAACWLAGTPPGPVAHPDHSTILLCSGITETQVLEALRAAADVSRAEPDASGDVRLTCGRDGALVDVRLLKGADRVMVMLDRRLSRRGHRVADLALLNALAEALRTRGGSILA